MRLAGAWTVVLALLDTMQRVKILPDTVYCSSQAMIGAVAPQGNIIRCKSACLSMEVYPDRKVSLKFLSITQKASILRKLVLEFSVPQRFWSMLSTNVHCRKAHSLQGSCNIDFLVVCREKGNIMEKYLLPVLAKTRRRMGSHNRCGLLGFCRIGLISGLYPLIKPPVSYHSFWGAAPVANRKDGWLTISSRQAFSRIGAAFPPKCCRLASEGSDEPYGFLVGTAGRDAYSDRHMQLYNF